MFNYKFSNLTKSPKTTLLALIILFIMLAFVWFQKASFLEVSPGFLFVVHFLFTGKTPDQKPMIILLLASISLLFFGCNRKITFQECKEKFGESLKDTQIVTIDTIIPRETTLKTFIYDTLKYYDRVETHNGRAKVELIKNGNEITVFGECDTITYYKTIKVPVEKVVFQDKEKFIEKPFFQTWQSYGMLFFIMLCFFFSYLLIRQTK